LLSIAFFASGNGTNMSAVMDKISNGDLSARVEFVLSNNSKSGALQKARGAGVRAYHVSGKTEGGDENVPARMIELLKSHRIDLLVLVGYMKKLPLEVIRRMLHKTINIHPALLPAFGGPGYFGDRIHKAVLERGCQFTGVTVHAVDPDYDEGPIILQRVVPVKPAMRLEELRESVMSIEYDSLWRVIAGFSEGILKSSSDNLAGIPEFQKWVAQDLPSSS